MSNTLIALFASVGASGWIYAKVNKTTGNNTKSALAVAAVSGLFIFIVILMILNAMFKTA